MLFLIHSSMQQSLTVLVPRVWPFLRHTISSVRRAALETLFTLLSKADQVNYIHMMYAIIYIFPTFSILQSITVIKLLIYLPNNQCSRGLLYCNSRPFP